ncbi:MAG: tetratricopeptide repeat protein [Rhodospirillales bacterium]|nr:tetratricopeptide repeat protein [Rhodospirillales bacterium]
MTPALAAALEHHRAGRLMEAQAAAWTIVRADPRAKTAWRLLGDVAMSLGQPQAAFDFFGNAVDLDPQDWDVRIKIGQALLALDRPVDAAANFRMAALGDPTRAEAHRLLADSLIRQGEHLPAAQALRRFLEIELHNVPALLALGRILIESGRAREAVAPLEQAMLLEPDDPLIRVELGNAHAALGENELARQRFDEALALDPLCAAAAANIGNLLFAANDLAGALEWHERAHKAKPDDARHINNRGVALKELGRIEEADQAFAQAIARDPDFAEAHWNRATTMFLKDRWREGFAEAEWRWKMKEFASQYRLPRMPVWDGSDLRGATVLVLAEQGYGDSLQFVRYLPKLAAKAAQVTFACDSRLVELVGRSFPSVRVVDQKDSSDKADCQAPLLSLPHRLDHVAPSTPYLKPDPQKVALWRDLLGEGVKVGIAWQGDPGHKADRRRSFGLAALLPLFEIPGLRFFSLQRGPARRDLHTMSNPPRDLGDESDPLIGTDFDTSAAIVANLDLVISADSAPAHLAGGLGRPVWMPINIVPDWRWGLSGERSFWYPSMTLFRQARPNDWSEPVARMRERLAGRRDDRFD